MSVYGQQLADQVGQPNTPPFPTQLNGTQVTLGGQALPLRYVGGGQVNAQVPFGLPVNTALQLVVQRGVTLSVPQDVVVAAAQPAVYTQDQSGKGAGVIVDANTGNVVTGSTPAGVGDTVVIYCNGLGAVSPPLAPGAPAPLGGPLSSDGESAKRDDWRGRRNGEFRRLGPWLSRPVSGECSCADRRRVRQRGPRSLDHSRAGQPAGDDGGEVSRSL